MSAWPSFPRRAATLGFTLIELMIAVAIVAIVTAIALPTYTSSVQKSRRADAMAAFANIQQAQERWRSNNAAYSTDLGATGLNVAAPQHYGLAVTAPNSTAGSLARGYIVTATGQGPQSSDAQCARMSVRLLEGNVRYAGCGTCSSFSDTDYTAAHRCFNR